MRPSARDPCLTAPVEVRAAAWPRQRGLTLIELMVVMALLAIVAAIAAPGMRSFAAGIRVKSLANELTADLLVARSEALKRNTSVTVTPNGSGWQAGWTVGTTADVLLQREASRADLQFEAPPPLMIFNASGRLTSPVGTVRMTVLSSDLQAEAAKRCVEVDPSGRARTRIGSCT
jgi:type IV fimbrial biogenesis protein FimT